MMIGLVLIGFLSGIISGMGIGGGAILIPSLVFLFGFDQQAAQHINLIYFIPTAIIALCTHAKAGNIETSVLPKIIFFGLIGAGVGSFIAVKADPELLRRIFGGFLLCVGVRELLTKETPHTKSVDH